MERTPERVDLGEATERNTSRARTPAGPTQMTIHGVNREENTLLWPILPTSSLSRSCFCSAKQGVHPAFPTAGKGVGEGALMPPVSISSHSCLNLAALLSRKCPAIICEMLAGSRGAWGPCSQQLRIQCPGNALFLAPRTRCCAQKSTIG